MSHLPAAGIVEKGPRETTSTLFSNREIRPPTPSQMRPFRSSCIEVGKSIKHIGLRNDQNPPPVSHGIKTKPDNVSIFPPQESLIQSNHREWAERRYQSCKKPLAHSRTVIEEPPEFTQTQDFAFGIRNECHASSTVAKEILAVEEVSDDEETHQMYIKSHYKLNPAEQVKRNYNWTVDPNTFVFGEKSTVDYSGSQAKSCIQMGSDPRTVVTRSAVSSALKSCREIGTPKYRNSAPNHVIQNNSQVNSDSDSVPPALVSTIKNCFINEDELKDFRLDCTLAKSIPGVKTVIPNKEDVVFGVYGGNTNDKFDSASTLQSGLSGQLGLSDDDFRLPISREKLFKIVSRAKLVFNRNEFNSIVSDLDELISVEQFKARWLAANLN
ncbi:hypothetical protein RCL1_003192 [Eukaryota sp. TZLM3-RCL]